MQVVAKGCLGRRLFWMRRLHTRSKQGWWKLLNSYSLRAWVGPISEAGADPLEAQEVSKAAKSLKVGRAPGEVAFNQRLGATGSLRDGRRPRLSWFRNRGKRTE